MQTPWGEVPVCDAHVHFFSPAFFRALAGQVGCTLEELGSRLGWRLPESHAGLAEAWIAELDAHGIAQAALIASIPGDEDSVATAMSLYPWRFYGYTMVNPIAPDSLERVQAAFSRGLQGICLFPAMHRYPIGDPRVRPILEAAAARPGVIVFVHCGVLTVGVRRKLGLPSPFDMRYSNPIDLHPIAAEFSRLNFVIPHFGAGYFREALMLCDLCPNVHLDTSSSNSWMRYQMAAVDLPSVFRKALEVTGPARLLFGSDSSFFPRGWQAPVYEAQVQTLRELAIGAEAAHLILGGNLQRLLAR